MELKYRIGLEIGIGSVGWAVLENGIEEEPIRIIDLGVRTFEAAEIPKTGLSLAEPRRVARSTRRKLRRRSHRLERVKWLLQQEGIIEINQYMKRYYSRNLPDVFKLRYEALNRKLQDEELAQILIYIAGHRGFCSNRKADIQEKDNGVVLTAIEDNQRQMEEKEYRTAGEMIYRDANFHTPCSWNEAGYILTPRNTQGSYRHTMPRSLLVEEVRYIFCIQRKLGNVKATELLEENYLKIMLSQRSFDMGPGKQADGTPGPYGMEGFEHRVGLCALEPKEMLERRGAKAAYTAELFVVLQKINNLSLTDKRGDIRKLTAEERQKLLESIHSKNGMSYTAVRKNLNISEQYRFHELYYSSKNFTEAERRKEAEKAKFIEMPFYHEYKKRIGEVLSQKTCFEQQELMDEIGTIFTLFKNDDSRTKKLRNLGLNQKNIEHLLELNPSKFQHISLKAMHRLIPYLKQGLSYRESCQAAGYQMDSNEAKRKRKLLKGQEITDILKEINNPIVKRSVSQTIKVINAIILKYGSPQAVHVEMARELSKTYVSRKKQERQMASRKTENERVRREIQELGILSPSGHDILKYRLWHEQQKICLYSGNPIPLEKLLGEDYEIDHILPFSFIVDDSYRNKVLVEARENRLKGNRTPYEYFGEDKERWKEFESRVSTFVGDYWKQQNLLKENFTQEDREQRKQSNLKDTQYNAAVLFRMIKENLELAPTIHSSRQNQVYIVNGAITVYLKKRWGMTPKDLSTDIHYAKNAVVTACCTAEMLRRITHHIQGRELLCASDCTAVDTQTGEIIKRGDFTQEEWTHIYEVRFPKPWDYFTEELEIRTGSNPKEYLDSHSDICKKINYPDYIYHGIHPIFVSRMPRHKVTGTVHADTIRSPRHYLQEGHKLKGCVLTRTALTDLKLDKDGEIANYYNKTSDFILYNALKKQLMQFDGDAKKAFEQPFYKTKADGTLGNIVKKVKLYDKLGKGVWVNNENGITANANGSMVRIDIFCENKKYYFVPVYLSDVIKKDLPDKAATLGKPWEEWKVIKEENFVFSLYSRDLIQFKHKKGKVVQCTDGSTRIVNEEPVYYISANIKTASIVVKAHDSSFTFDSFGIQSLIYLEKYQVDILGKISKVKAEKRLEFNSRRLFQNI